MKRRLRFGALILTAAALGLAACGQPISDKHVIDEPAEVTEVAGLDVWKVTLTPRATERLGIETTRVSDREGDLAVPSSSLWLDTKGLFWVYTNPEPNVYLRHVVDVVDDDGSFAVLAAGPSIGTPIVSVGVSELYGTEVGVGK
ncbi:MAG: hypothetical protein HKN91_06770 [Acidimicrobiia bacterium]|nr:hypothetical protein [Acidimicrobiia bacterium]